MKSDDQYLARVKENYSKRKKRAFYILLFAFAYLIFTIYATNELQVQLATLKELAQPFIPSIPATDAEISLSAISIEIIQGISTKLGIFVGTAAAFFGIAISQAIYLLFGGRKERLLIKYYEQSKT